MWDIGKTLQLDLDGGIVVIKMGVEQFVFEMPGYPDLLLKVKRPEKQFRTNRYGMYRHLAREMQNYIAARAELGTHPHFIQRPVGFVDTNFGLGYIVEKFRWSDGSIAPTLRAYVTERGFTEQVQHDLNELESGIDRAGIVTCDLRTSNIVYAFTPERGYFLAIVDGIGDKSFLQMNQISKNLRRLANRRHFAAIHAKCAKISKGAIGRDESPLPSVSATAS